MRCDRCEADLPAGTRFCTRCGERTGAASPGGESGEVGRGSPPLLPVEARLVHCPACDAANAASRRFCGRCGDQLRPGEDFLVLPETEAPPGGVAPPPSRDSGIPAVLLVVTVLAALAILGVVLTILSARGVGLFAGPPSPEDPGEPLAADVVAVSASSEVPPAGELRYGPENLVDGDETTAWKEGVAGDGAGEWVDLELAAEAGVVRLLVWNGYQRPGQFRDHSRVARARLEIGDRTFTADLLDVDGPQAIELPVAVRADRVRLEILAVHPGQRYEDTAISRLEVLVRPDG